MSDLIAQMRRTAAIVTATVGLLTGCEKKASPDTDRVRSPDPTLAANTLPARPQVEPNESIVKLFSDTSLPQSVRHALYHPAVHGILSEIWHTASHSEPMTYHRNAYEPEAGREVVKVLQFLLNENLPIARQKGAAHAAALEEKAVKDASPFKADAVAAAQWIKNFLKRAPKAIAIDGDFGKTSHHARAFITQIANITDHFPHKREDSGANDTAIGPRTLKLLTEVRPEFREYFQEPFSVVGASFGKAIENGSR